MFISDFYIRILIILVNINLIKTELMIPIIYFISNYNERTNIFFNIVKFLNTYIT